MKQCSQCLRVKASVEFYPHKSRKRGICKECHSINSKRNYRKKKDYYKKLRAKYSRKPEVREYHRKKGKQWREENRSRFLEYKKKYYQKNKEKWGDYRKGDKYRLVHRLCQQRRRARLKGVGGGFNKEEWLEILIRYGHKCVNCGHTAVLTIDHIVPIVKGGKHSKENIQPLCQPCNSKKGVD